MTRMPRLGELERQVMDVLWGATERLTARQVLEQLHCESALAYTTIATVLGNLVRKDLACRNSEGRALSYAPTNPRSAYVSGLMHEALSESDNRETAFMHFVRDSSAADLDLLRRLINEPTGS